MSKYRHEVISPTNKLLRYHRGCKTMPPDWSLRLLMSETRSAGSTGAILLPGPWCPVGRLRCRRGRRRGWWCQGCLPGILLEFNKLATLSRVDRENHALLTVASLLAVEPHRVRVFHSVLCPREGLLVFCHWHTDRTNQYASWTKRRMRDLQSSVESASKRRTRGLERGLCDGVVLLLEDERDDLAGVGRLVMMVCPEAHDKKLYGGLTTKEGLY